MSFWRAIGILIGGVLVYFLASIAVAVIGIRGYEGAIGGGVALVFLIYQFTRRPKIA